MPAKRYLPEGEENLSRGLSAPLTAEDFLRFPEIRTKEVKPPCVDPGVRLGYTFSMVQVPIDTILDSYPAVQAVYLFGSAADGSERPDSDIDIALLLPPGEAKAAGSLAFSGLKAELEKRLGRRVDLVNLRTVSTVFQKEITCFGIRIFTAPGDEADIFEMLVLSFYGKLNEERAEILESFVSSGRAYEV